jgi:hypothetical protein
MKVSDAALRLSAFMTSITTLFIKRHTTRAAAMAGEASGTRETADHIWDVVAKSKGFAMSQ